MLGVWRRIYRSNTAAAEIWGRRRSQERQYNGVRDEWDICADIVEQEGEMRKIKTFEEAYASDLEDSIYFGTP